MEVWRGLPTWVGSALECLGPGYSIIARNAPAAPWVESNGFSEHPVFWIFSGKCVLGAFCFKQQLKCCHAIGRSMLTGRGRETGQFAQRWQAPAFFGGGQFFKWRF